MTEISEKNEIEWTAKIEIRKTEFSAADEARKLSYILSYSRRRRGNLQNDNSGFSVPSFLRAPSSTEGRGEGGGG